MSSALRPAGSTWRWRKVRAAVLLANARANAGRCVLNVGVRCQRHGKPCPGICTGRAQTVHHINGREHGDDPRNLMPSCAACNGHVGKPKNNANRARPNPVSWA